MQPPQIACDPVSGRVSSFKLYGEELLDAARPSNEELFINGVPLATRLWPDAAAEHKPAPDSNARMRGERFVNFWAGAGIVIQRDMGTRRAMKWPCLGVQYWVRRDLADVKQVTHHGPGGPAVEAPLWIDSLTMLNWNWKFWGDDTRMIFASSHSSGPDGEWGHVGYENNPPEFVKSRMNSPWRRTYPGTMVIHGGLYHNARTGHWIALTCRRPHMSFALNLTSAGRGVGYDFLMHAPFNIGDHLRLPEFKIYYGDSRDSMDRWTAEYVTQHYKEPPEWVFKTHFMHGLAWTNEATWTEQAEAWEKTIDDGQCSGISYSLVTSRPVLSGTLPTSYAPDANHGSIDEFKAMCRRVADKGVKQLVWMSHSGLTPGELEIDDDWFIRGIDGRPTASWGGADSGMYFVNVGHPGYIEYTKKWISFYIKECRCNGIFFDCYGFIFPPDFRPRQFMRYPADSNLMAIRFMEEIYAHIKACDPEAVILGEGVSLDGPINIFSVHTNPIIAEDGLSPRDWFLRVGLAANKRMVVDQGPDFMAASGMCKGATTPENAQLNRYMTKLLREHGGRDSAPLPGDMGIVGNVLVVPPVQKGHALFTPDGTTDRGVMREVRLPEKWKHVTVLTAALDGTIIKRNPGGTFERVQMGAWKMS